ncbi:FMN-binding protein [Pseudarthrobacter sp. PS3-L1]|uniref:FMN-binding protein n=1 Tax=Pseudarthrobacter sp. PS3-L1 TaxID=3046207 RepID=UPI0024B9F1E1|nr:FMN-binding protein [Pseudarthrobacter sp. PS3-L1]MDJ0320895.1 FMN-binding protein [Pseudarthrobacter sp. PS3-L1]
MRTRALFASVTASLGILVAGWQLGTSNMPVTATPVAAAAPVAASSGGTATPKSHADPGASATTAPSTAGAAPVPDPGSASGSATSGTFTGMPVSERYGSVAVQITVTNGTITDVAANSSVGDSRSQQIEARAEKLLRTSVLTAQSAKVSMISGATYTSQAYLKSLQSALDQAHL